jgi:hypothetical protein
MVCVAQTSRKHGSTFIPLSSTASTPFTQASSDARDFAIALPTTPVSVTLPSLTSTGVVKASLFRARPARLDSVGQAERGKMSHEAKCLAMAVRPVVACASNICWARQSAFSHSN